MLVVPNLDGSLKSPLSALRFIHRHCEAQQPDSISRDRTYMFAVTMKIDFLFVRSSSLSRPISLDLGLFTQPLEMDSLRIHQSLTDRPDLKFENQPIVNTCADNDQQNDYFIV
jgi:hypothetical protein